MRFMYLRCRTSASSARRALAIVLVTSLAGLPVGGAVVHAQTPIQLFLSAVDNDGKPVTDLKAEEVAIQVDGADCVTTKFEAIDWPTKLTIMVDNSPVFNDALRQLREALRAFVTVLPTDMEVSLLSTAPAPRFIYKQGSDRVKLMSSIDLITPDGSAPRFIDALAEAAERAAKEKAGKENKANFFPVFFIVGNNAVEGSSPRDYQINKLFKQTIDTAATVHIVMLSNSSRQLDIGSGTNQIELGIKLTQLTGGRYEAIAAQTRLTTLLPEFATQITRSHARQSHQYRITCEPPKGAAGQRVTAATNRSNISAALTLDGRIP
jgi:hypothetical protein